MRDIAAILALVAVGSAFGGVVRFVVSGLVARAVGETFPWGTLVVNVTGSFSIGVLAQIHEIILFSTLPELWPLAVVGFLGSYTTVSSFSLQTLALARDRQWPKAATNVVLSLGLCLAAVALGVLAGHALAPDGAA